LVVGIIDRLLEDSPINPGPQDTSLESEPSMGVRKKEAYSSDGLRRVLIDPPLAEVVVYPAPASHSACDDLKERKARSSHPDLDVTDGYDMHMTDIGSA
jgi:hypothetical protein